MLFAERRRLLADAGLLLERSGSSGRMVPVVSGREDRGEAGEGLVAAERVAQVAEKLLEFGLHGKTRAQADEEVRLAGAVHAHLLLLMLLLLLLPTLVVVDRGTRRLGDLKASVGLKVNEHPTN